MSRQRRACFFARVKNRELLELVQWYKNDIRMLEDLGYSVSVATRFREIDAGCDILFSWWCTTSIYPLIKAKWRRKPLIVLGCGSEVIHSLSDIPGYHSKPWPVRLAVRLSLKYADCTLAISRHQLEEIERLGARQARAVYLGVDTEEYEPAYEPESAAEKLVLTISHLNEENVERKKIWTVLKAIPLILRESPAAKFAVVGRHMKAYPELRSFVEQAGVDRHVDFPGLVSQAQKLSYLRRASVYVQPTKHEAFGMAIAEAMSCGLPVVSSRSGAVPEILGDCGLYADPDDPRDLADKVIWLLRNESAGKELGRKARERIMENFTYERRKREIERILSQITGN